MKVFKMVNKSLFWERTQTRKRLPGWQTGEIYQKLSPYTYIAK